MRRDFTDVRDVVHAYRLALEHAEPGVYNVCSGRSTEIREILDGLATHAEVELEQTHRPRAAARARGRARFAARTTSSPRRRAGSREIPLERTLADTLEWWRDRVAAAVGDAAAAAY